MTFPPAWGPPPAFAGTEVLPDGTTRCIQSDSGVENSLKDVLCASVNKRDDENGFQSYEAASRNLHVFTVEGCPAASSELLVRKKRLISVIIVLYWFS